MYNNHLFKKYLLWFIMCLVNNLLIYISFGSVALPTKMCLHFILRLNMFIFKYKTVTVWVLLYIHISIILAGPLKYCVLPFILMLYPSCPSFLCACMCRQIIQNQCLSLYVRSENITFPHFVMTSLSLCIWTLVLVRDSPNKQLSPPIIRQSRIWNIRIFYKKTLISAWRPIDLFSVMDMTGGKNI